MTALERAQQPGLAEKGTNSLWVGLVLGLVRLRSLGKDRLLVLGFNWPECLRLIRHFLQTKKCFGHH